MNHIHHTYRISLQSSLLEIYQMIHIHHTYRITSLGQGHWEWHSAYVMAGMKEVGWNFCAWCPTLYFLLRKRDGQRNNGQLDKHNWLHRSTCYSQESKSKSAAANSCEVYKYAESNNSKTATTNISPKSCQQDFMFAIVSASFPHTFSKGHRAFQCQAL